MDLFFLWITHLFLDFLMGIWPMYKTMSGLNLAASGMLVSLAALIGESSQIIFGFYADARGHRNYIVFGLTLACGVLFIPYTQNFLLLFICLLMLYIGSGCYHPSASGLASHLRPKQKGFIMTFFSSGGQIGLAISQLLFVWAFMKLQGHTLVLALPILLVLALFYWIHQPPSLQKKPSSISLKALVTPFKEAKKPIGILYICQVANQMAMYGLIFLLPELLKIKQFSSFFIYGGGHFFLIMGSGICMLLAGFLSDTLGEKKMILTCALTSFIGYYLFLMFTPTNFLTSAMSLFVLGGFLGSLNPLFVSLGHKMYPNAIGLVSAILMGFAWCLATSSFALSGMLADTFGILNALIFIGTFNLLPLALFTFASMPSIQKAN